MPRKVELIFRAAGTTSSKGEQTEVFEETVVLAAAAAGSLVSLLADRKSLAVQVRVRRQATNTTGAIRHFDHRGRSHPYRSVAEDIEWFQNEWLVRSDYLSDTELRRGSTQLRLLLVDDLVGQAWRSYGFQRQPSIDGPDLIALTERSVRYMAHGLRLTNLSAIS